MNEQVLLSVSKVLDPPKSTPLALLQRNCWRRFALGEAMPLAKPLEEKALRASCGGGDPKTAVAPLKKADFDSGSPLFKGVRGDLKVPKITVKYLFIQPLRMSFSRGLNPRLKMSLILLAQRKAYGMASLRDAPRTLRASPRTLTEKQATLLASRRERHFEF